MQCEIMVNNVNDAPAFPDPDQGNENAKAVTVVENLTMISR